MSIHLAFPGKLHWDVTDSAKWPLDLYFEAMREANKHVQDSASDREELEWSERNLARMAVLRDRAYDDLVQQGGVPRCALLTVQRWAPSRSTKHLCTRLSEQLSTCND